MRVRVCANKVVAGVRGRALMCNIRLARTRVITSASDLDKLEGLAVAIPWRFESSLPHQPEGPLRRAFLIAAQRRPPTARTLHVRQIE